MAEDVGAFYAIYRQVLRVFEVILTVPNVVLGPFTGRTRAMLLQSRGSCRSMSIEDDN